MQLSPAAVEFFFNIYLAVSGLSCGTWTLVVECGLQSNWSSLPPSMWGLSSSTRGPLHARQIPNRWTAGEVPLVVEFWCKSTNWKIGHQNTTLLEEKSSHVWIFFFPVVMCGCESWTIKLSAKELMPLNCGVGEDSWESFGLKGDQTGPS